MAASPVPRRLNPDPDPALEREVAFFLKCGYLIVEEAVTAEQVDILRTALDAAFARSGEQFIHQLLEEDERFAFLLDNPPVFRRIKAILGTCVQLHSATARITTGGEPDQDWLRCEGSPPPGPAPANACAGS